jgi:quercetin dioxygenase-like cupin family protein
MLERRLCDGRSKPVESRRHPAHAGRLDNWRASLITCEGNHDFRLGEKLLKLGPGGVVFVPRGTPHGFI